MMLSQYRKREGLLVLITRLCPLLILLCAMIPLKLHAATITSSFTLGADADQTSSALGLIGQIALTDSIKATAFLGASKKLTGLREESLENGRLEINGSFNIMSFLFSDSALTFIAPLNQDQRQLDSFRGAINLATSARLTHKAFSLSYGISNLANLYRYNLNRNNAQNPNFTLTHKINFSFDKNRLCIRISFNNAHRWNHAGNRISDQFTMEESLSWKIDKKMTVLIGHRNGGNTFAANGTDPNIEVFDKDTSLFYSTLRYQF